MATMKPDKFWLLTAAVALIGLIGAFAVAADQAQQREAQKARLAQLQFLVGSWKGVAQPQRGSSKGSWVEQAEWAWRFDRGNAELVAELRDSKLFSTIVLQAGDMPGAF